MVWFATSLINCMTTFHTAVKQVDTVDTIVVVVILHQVNIS